MEGFKYIGNVLRNFHAGSWLCLAVMFKPVLHLYKVMAGNSDDGEHFSHINAMNINLVTGFPDIDTEKFKSAFVSTSGQCISVEPPGRHGRNVMLIVTHAG